MKLERVVSPDGKTTQSYLFWCPGCGQPHALPASLAWNNDANRPDVTMGLSFVSFAFLPNVCGQPSEYLRCALLIRNGKLVYLGQSNHRLRNRIVDMVEWPFVVNTPAPPTL